MVDAQLDAAHDGEAELLHQVVNLADRASRAVFDGQNAIAAHPLIHRVKNRLKGFEIHDAGQREELLASSLGIRAFHALAGHDSLIRHFGGRLLQRLAHFLLQRGILVDKLALIGAGEVEQRVKQHFGISRKLWAGRFGDAV